MNWQAIMALQVIFVGASMITLRVLARDNSTARASFVITAAMYVTSYLSMLPLVPLIGSVNGHVVVAYWWRLIGGGLAFALTNVCTYMTLVYFEASIATIVGAINTIFVALGAWLVLGEGLSPLQICGALLLLGAISYGVLVTHTITKAKARRSVVLGTTFAVLAGLTYVVAMVNEKSLLMHMSAATYIVYGVGGQCAMAVLVALMLQSRFLHVLGEPRVIGWSVFSGLLRGLAGACFIVAEVKSNKLGLVSVIANFRLIVVIFLGAWLLKERQYLKQKLVAATGAVAGVAVMFWK